MGEDPKAKRAQELVELARVGEISEAEEKFLRAVATGEVADFRSGEPAEDNPENAEQWGAERTLRAEVVAWACLDKEAKKYVTHHGIQVIGAKIEGPLDLNFAKLLFPLGFFDCHFDTTLLLLHAVIELLNLNGSRLESRENVALFADGIEVKGGVFLREGFKAEGEVRLLDATISGNLDCTKGEFHNSEGHALNADGIEIKGSVFLKKGFKAEGEVRFLGAIIGGDLDCTRGEFRNPGKIALNAGGIGVKGAVFLREGFKAEGEVRFLRATIGGNLDCTKGEFHNPEGHALSADGIEVKGGVFLREGFKAEGEVRLLGATIGGNLSCVKGEFHNPEGHALSADGIRVEGAVFLRDFEILGVASFVEARVERYFSWRGVRSPKEAILDLRDAFIKTLDDEEKSWPEEIHLEGLVYEHLSDLAPKDVKTRLDWLRRQPEESFRSQPYEQLARILKESGYEEESRRIQYEKAKERVKRLRWWKRWLLWAFFGSTVGFGWYPWKRSICWALALVVIGAVIYGFGFRGGVIRPVVPHLSQDPMAMPVLDLASTSILYSLDAFLPLVNLHQTEAFAISHDFRNILTWISWASFVFQAVGGWALTTLLIGALTGLMRR